MRSCLDLEVDLCDTPMKPIKHNFIGKTIILKVYSDSKRSHLGGLFSKLFGSGHQKYDFWASWDVILYPDLRVFCNLTLFI